jgi:hypothetical protein
LYNLLMLNEASTKGTANSGDASMDLMPSISSNASLKQDDSASDNDKNTIKNKPFGTLMYRIFVPNIHIFLYFTLYSIRLFIASV